MLFKKNHADGYHAAVKKLTRAENDYRATVDELFNAKNQHRAADVPPLRRQAAQAEEAVKSYLADASRHWRGYWLEQAEALEPDLLNAAFTMDRYDAVCRIVGGFGASPAASRIQGLRIVTTRHDFTDCEVPTDEPDSDTLEDLCGIWR